MSVNYTSIKLRGKKKTLAVGQLGGNHQDEFDKF